ncbi:TPA: threonine/serine exporter family protein [Corynebacterium striatum]|nr:threonine/serine exporter family protein [Corynebacterium striatum]HAT1175287.1 threonine/serine exporter family protein [Corynebacterium striatum]HAT1243178.1 threonine/serine exporter family protein [Corynebacterium striatum]HAT1294028.1 threonine/serine exporter family protein [Corynebacterium striatum]HAT1304285.1 threonine/serine exporter family protein [Corynebacterium striatum]
MREPTPDYVRMGIEADVILRLGMLLMGAGTSGYRVLRGMKRAARALGFDRLDANVGVTQITCTFHKGRAFRTVVAQQHSPAVDASRIEALEDLTHHRLYAGITAEELDAFLDDIESHVIKRWNGWVLASAAGVACASFAVLNYFQSYVVLLVALAAFCGQFTRWALHHRHVHQLGCIVAGGAVSSMVYFLTTEALALIGWADPAEFSSGYVAAVLFLIPGFPLFSAIIDLARFDFDAGMARLSYSLTVIIAATFTVAMVSWFTELTPIPPAPAPDATWYAAAVVASFLGIAGFAFLFNSSRRMVLAAALVGTVANMARLGILSLGTTSYFAAFVGGVIIGLLGAQVARKMHLPRITTTVPAAVIMIPGTAMFRAVFHLNAGNMDQSLSNLATATMVVMSIGCGLVFARLLSDRDWALGRLIDFSRPPHDSRY